MASVRTQLDSRGVLRVTLNRADVHNAFDDELIGRLTEVLQQAERDQGVRILVLTGSGPAFSAGADLHWMSRMAAASRAENKRDALALAGLFRTLNYLDRPAIARVNGAAYGGGVGLVACCDIAVAVDSARFGLTEVRLGLAPAVVSPYVIRTMGEGNARRYFLTGERFGADRAAELGLVQQVVGEQVLDEAVEQFISRLLRAGPEALRASKRLALRIAGADRDEQERLDQYTAGLIAQLRVSQEGREGLAAFLEKRPPRWMGPGAG